MKTLFIVIISVILTFNNLYALTYAEAQRMLKEERSYNKTHSSKKTAGQLQSERYRKNLERRQQQSSSRSNSDSSEIMRLYNSKY